MYLSEFIKKSIYNQEGKKIGRFHDVIVSSETPYPIIKAISIEKNDKNQFRVPWNQISEISKNIILKSDLNDISEYITKKGDINLLKDVLDRQVVDIEDKKIRRVNDLKISATNGYFHVIGVDIGIYGILRRLGLKRFVQTFGTRGQEDLIAWNDIDTIQSGYSNLKLKVPKQKIKKLHPADIAEIVDQLGLNESMTILNSLDDESAADTLEEVSPERQVSLLGGMDSKRAADLLDEMSPDDAADLLADLPEKKAEELLELMDPLESRDVRKLLEYPENTAGGIMTTEYVYVNQNFTAKEVLNELRKVAQDVETIYYIYVKSDNGDLVGVTSLRELLLAKPEKKVSEFMHSDVIKVDVREDQYEVAKKIAKYNLIALPVVEKEKKIKGIITVDDAIDIVLPTAWKKRVPRMFR